MMLISGSVSFTMLLLAAAWGLGLECGLLVGCFCHCFLSCFIVRSVTVFFYYYLCATATIHMALSLVLALSLRWGWAGAFMEDASPTIPSIPAYG